MVFINNQNTKKEPTEAHLSTPQGTASHRVDLCANDTAGTSAIPTFSRVDCFLAEKNVLGLEIFETEPLEGTENYPSALLRT